MGGTYLHLAALERSLSTVSKQRSESIFSLILKFSIDLQVWKDLTYLLLSLNLVRHFSVFIYVSVIFEMHYARPPAFKV